MFVENTKKISSFIKNIDKDVSKFQKQYWDALDKRMDSIIDEEIIKEHTIEKWDLILHDSSYHILRDKLKERLNITDNNDIDSNTKLISCYWDEDNKHCKCVNGLCLVNCDNGKMWYSEELIDYFGIEQYKYDLIVGGPKHGTFIINSNHPDNNNEEDIEIKIKDFGREFDCIEEIRHYVQDSYDRNNAVHREGMIIKERFELFKKKHKIKKILELYELIKPLYSELIGYHSRSKAFYDIFIHKLDDLVAQALHITDTNKDFELNEITKKLQIDSEFLKRETNKWYNISKTALKNNFTDDICHYICDYI
jgi:hypothetical protein